MVQAAPHPEDGRRLEVLGSYDVLDTAPEKDFEDVVALASRLCEAPVSLISLVEADRQWFKARAGFPVPETPIDRSICAHAILENGHVEISDLTLDPRTADNPLVTGPEAIRFYAGAQLLSPEGLPLGMLCVLDTRPRALNDLQREALRVLARQVMAQLEMRRALRLAETLRHEVDHRVKNSLQSLSALAGIKARVARTDEARHALTAIQRRIHTVAMLHEQLYKTNAGSIVDLGTYLSNMATYLGAQAPQNIAIRCETERVLVGSEQAAAVGTLVNEFAANSIKHAFPEERPGIIRFRLCTVPQGEGTVMVEACDDGIGLPDVAQFTAGLGTQIMQATADQLGGKLEIARCPEGAGTGLLARVLFQPRLGD